MHFPNDKFKNKFLFFHAITASFFHPHPHSLTENMRWKRGCLYSAWLYKQIIRTHKKDKTGQNLIILITGNINYRLLQIMDSFE